MATKNLKKKIPLESVRAGAEDDSPIDKPVINPGVNTTTNKIIGMTHITSAVRQELQICSWSKVTSIRTLKIHQGRIKCLKEVKL